MQMSLMTTIDINNDTSGIYDSLAKQGYVIITGSYPNALIKELVRGSTQSLDLLNGYMRKLANRFVTYAGIENLDMETAECHTHIIEGYSRYCGFFNFISHITEPVMVWNCASQSWDKIEPIPNSFIVYVGETLSAVTQCLPHTYCYAPSAVQFCYEPSYNYLVSEASEDNEVHKCEKITYGEYLRRLYTP